MEDVLAVYTRRRDPDCPLVRLDRHIPDKQTLIDETAAWEAERNRNHTKADWQFTTDNARIKLKHLYPSI